MRRIIIGMTEATGAVFGVKLRRQLPQCSAARVHSVLSRWARATIQLQPGLSSSGVASLADVVYSSAEQTAAIRTGNAAPAHRKPAPSNRSVPARQESTSHILARAPSSPTVFATPELTAPLRSPDGTACCSLPRLLGSVTDLAVCQPRCTKNPQSVPWVCGAVENGRSIDTSINRGPVLVATPRCHFRKLS
jgi:hypothetical protein